MLHIIGLGLNEKGISIEGKETLKKCKKVYLENYTVEFPYKLEKLEKIINKKIISLDRTQVENEKLVIEAKEKNICLLVYGCPLFATTHISLIEDCKKNKVKYKIIYASSVFDAIAESGLQLYKFGKIASMPTWEKNFTPDSFLDFVKENKSINAHSLILIDIGLSFKDALNQLIKGSKNKKFKLDKILVCSQLGFKSKFYYNSINKLKKKKIKTPFCFVIPGKLHFLEEEVLERFT
jgi:diphthine synthase